MDEPVGLVLRFLRQHNFEKAEEALRLEFYARHSSTNYSDRHIKVDVASHDVDVTACTDCQGKEPLPQISSMKSKFDCSKESGIVDKKMRAYAEWEFKSCTNDDCVLEFKKQDPQLRRLSQEGSSSNDLDLRQNDVKPRDSIHESNLEGQNLACFQKPTGFPGGLRNGTAMGQRLTKKEQHNFEMTSDHALNMNALGKIQQGLDASELKNCPIDDESWLALQTSVHDGRPPSSPSYDQNFTSSMYHSFSDNNWLEHDAAKSLECRESSLQLLPVSEEFEQLEEKQVVHDCIDYIKALALEDQMKSPCFLKDMSLPWEIDLETQYVDGEFLNERQTENCLNVNSSCLRTSTGSFSIATGTIETFGIDKMHTNVLFEPAFNIGAFLDIPVGQELSSPGERREDGMFQLCCPQNSMQDTPELLSGFATLGGEPTDPGMGYNQDLWDSDMYEDDEDPGYERQEVEDEDWFLAHEIFHTNDKIGMIKEKTGEDILSQSNEGSEICQGKEDLSCFSRGVLSTEVSDLSQSKPGVHISNIISNLGQSTPSNVQNLNQVGSLRYDGHLMDAEELKFMRDETIWQGFSSQFDEHLHDDRVKVNDADDKLNDADNKLFNDHVSETESSSDGQSKKNTKQCNLKRDFLYEFDGCIGSVAYGAESIGSIDGISNNSKLDFILPALKQTRQHSNLSIGGDVSCCFGPLDLKSIDISRPIIMGCLRSTTANNQGMAGECSPWSVEAALFGEEKSIENPKYALLPKQANEVLPALENGTSSNPALVLHSTDQSHVPFPNELHEVRRDTTTVPDDYDCGVNEVPMDDGEISLEQGEAQLLQTEEDEYEVFSLRIIHRKNRTGFEEEKQFQVIMNSVVAGRYLITEYLGSAAFSKAVQARDLQTGMDVCMKIIKNNKDFFDQSLDEIKLLKYINKNDPSDKHHLLRLYDYFYHREHLFIVCELLRANLYEFHKFNKESGGEPYFTMSRLQLITRQCLEALEFLHCLGLIHCDLKPENILIKSYSQCEIKVIDLGSSCFQTDHLCSYVQSRSYRAPEVILGLPYNEKIDIWSLGCILAELCSGNVLFQNDSLATLLARVIGIIEPIVGNMILDGKESHKYFTKNSMLYERNQDTNKLEYLIPKKSSLRHRLRSGDQGFVDFVGYLLQVNPENRPSASEALKHPWLTHPYDALCK